MPDGRLNPLLEQVLRKDPGEAQRQQTERVFGDLQKQRDRMPGAGVGLSPELETILMSLIAPVSSAVGYGSELVDKALGSKSDGMMQAVVPAAIKDKRKATLAALAALGKTGPKTPYHEFLEKQKELTAKASFADPWQKKEGVDVFRAARDLTPPSDRRLGGFYTIDTPRTRTPDYNEYITSGNTGTTGGAVVQNGTFHPRNPYLRNSFSGTPDGAVSKLVGENEAAKIRELAKRRNIDDEVRKGFGKYGINKKELDHIWSAEEGSWARQDAVLSKLLQNSGYDSLMEFGNPTRMKEFFKLREPRYNFSHDAQKGKPRGMTNVGFLEQISKAAPKSELDKAAFASGRSPALGMSNVKSPAPTRTKLKPEELEALMAAVVKENAAWAAKHGTK